eukprot:CAMPEP_0168314100 /NCGR_PEP_ID=MMETSP0210-20121227/6312_1 /TAXON_ID=40633 /ORGANISM="Condylostoma magnum, Strain COL2" /LENGTH=60 /DNA_ID=CAMNT_0008278737 /DNA_START=1801 /DNA_END=1983 /DNA_ORIENTATION=-
MRRITLITLDVRVPALEALPAFWIYSASSLPPSSSIPTIGFQIQPMSGIKDIVEMKSSQK